MCSLGELGFFGPGGGAEAGGGMARASIILGCATFVRGTVMVWVFGADSGFCVGYGTFLVLARILFWGRGGARGYNSMKYLDFPYISQLPNC